tara:strand:- start:708 stop:848 length:141 start_codon:yes stop_codon:yes gene_type:complete
MKIKDVNILCVGDLHCPFDLDHYPKFLKKAYDDFNCSKIVFLGDCL